MLRRFSIGFVCCILLSTVIGAITSLDVNFLNKTVVFFFRADANGNLLIHNQVATGFLLSIPRKNAQPPYLLLVTARRESLRNCFCVSTKRTMTQALLSRDWVTFLLTLSKMERQLGIKVRMTA